MDCHVLLDQLDVGIAVIAPPPEWTIVEWTAPAAAATGLPASQVIGQEFWAVFPSLRGFPTETTLRAVLADGQPRSYIVTGRAAESEGRLFETRASRGPDGHLILIFQETKNTLDPASRAAQILTAFEGERRAYRQLFTRLPSPALVLAADGHILDANRAALDLLKAPDALALTGRPLAGWITPEQRDTLITAVHAAEHEPQRLRLALLAGDEPLGEAEVVIATVDPGRVGANRLCLALDVTREVLLQRQLLRTDRLSQLGALVSGVAHELNNPLAAIAAFAELLAVDATTPELRESAEIIHAEAMRAGRVVQTLLDFARQRVRKPQAVDLQEVAERVVVLQRSALKKARVTATTTIPDDVPAVIGDVQELQQVLLNAVVNAREAIESTTRPGRIVITAQRNDSHVIVSVDDDGPGIPPAVLERAFEPFFTTKGEAGTGLGLAISLGLVKAMGGRLWLQNNEAGGARLAVELPSDVEPVTAAPRAGFRRADRALSVLVVEDEASVRRGMARMAERLGHRVASVAGFRDAERLLQETAGGFDVVLVDVHLDESHTGFDVFEALRQEGHGRERRVVFTTGDSISAHTRDRLQRADRPVLKKPFNLEDLRVMLDRVAAD
jgi:signal transduction histidine kinase/ActR/RegA family two-component response regulator